MGTTDQLKDPSPGEPGVKIAVNRVAEPSATIAEEGSTESSTGGSRDLTGPAQHARPRIIHASTILSSDTTLARRPDVNIRNIKRTCTENPTYGGEAWHYEKLRYER